jgi:hypothetical protein
MSTRGYLGRSVAALASISMLAVSVDPASAFTLTAPSLQQHFVSAEVQNVWWCRWNCGRPGWGWGPALVGGLVAGAVVGAAVAAPHRDPCWQRWVGPYGDVEWRRTC